MFDRTKQLRGNGRDAPKVAPHFSGVLLETEEFPLIFDMQQAEVYDEEDSDDDLILNPTWSDSECSDIEMDLDIDSDMDSDIETERETKNKPRTFGRPKKVLTKEDIEKDDQTLKLVS